jgi:hypothetical protein
MAKLIDVKTFREQRGCLSVIEKILPFEIKRIFYIYEVDDSVRGKHRHHKTIQAAICISGSCIISNNDGKEQVEYLLDKPDKCLILSPDDFHSMHSFSGNAVLLVMASEYFDPHDYIYEPY